MSDGSRAAVLVDLKMAAISGRIEMIQPMRREVDACKYVYEQVGIIAQDHKVESRNQKPESKADLRRRIPKGPRGN